jgi:hypothetical protein
MQRDKIEIAFYNSLNRPIIFGLEPYAVFYTMEPEQTFTLVVYDVNEGNIGVSYGIESITVGLPSGDGDVVLFQNEKEIFRW